MNPPRQKKKAKNQGKAFEDKLDRLFSGENPEAEKELDDSEDEDSEDE